MAVYYIDPHTTTNGTGTFASPWSLASSSRTGLASGDEIRILGVALTDLLTATTYAADITDNRSITITSGGSLGADFSANDIVYFPDKDTFGRVVSVSTNQIFFSSTSSQYALPWDDTSSGQTGVTVRRVDRTAYPASSTSATITLINDATVYSNLTISDCWTDAVTRVTDGTVKTLIYCSTTSATFNILVCNSVTKSSSGNVLNLQNTHAVGAQSTGISPLNVTFSYSNSILNINQIFAPGSSSIMVGTTSTPVENAEINITTFNCGACFSMVIGNSNSINVDSLILRNDCGNCLNSVSTAIAYADNLSATFQKITSYSASFLFLFSVAKRITLHIESIVDSYSNITSMTSLLSGIGKVSISYGSTFNLYANKRASTITSSPVGVIVDGPTDVFNSKSYAPALTLPTGWSTPSTKYNIRNYISDTTGTSYFTDSQSFSKSPAICELSLAENSGLSVLPSISLNQNLLITFRNGDDPIEILGTGSQYLSPGDSQSPVITTDSSTYQSTSPSLKASLNTYLDAMWSNEAKAIKNIKIPVTSGVSYTVTGYVRTDDSAYVNGDCVVSVFFNDTELDTQSMTTACINAWEQFTLTFTASETGEAYLAWEMLFANGSKSIWLSDLSIS